MCDLSCSLLRGILKTLLRGGGRVSFRGLRLPTGSGEQELLLYRWRILRVKKLDFFILIDGFVGRLQNTNTKSITGTWCGPGREGSGGPRREGWGGGGQRGLTS